MEELNKFSVKIKSNEAIIKSNEITDIVNMICLMAKQTENKNLNITKVTQAVERFISNKIFGQYFLIIDNLNKNFCGMNMITYEYNINLDKTIVWLQSVFIETEYRMKKLFKKLLEENINFVNSNNKYEKKVKLYMEKDNTTAEQVYLKVGFKVTDECLYEIDYDFDDITFLKSDDKKNSQLDEFISIKILTIEESRLITENLNSDYFSKINDKEIDLTSHLPAINSVLQDNNKGRIVYVYDNNNNKLICMFYIFFEYSDWRNSIFWWVYDMLIHRDYIEFCNLNIEKLIHHLIKLNHDSGSCGIRFITKSDNHLFLQNTNLVKSHYIIYEKVFI